MTFEKLTVGQKVYEKIKEVEKFIGILQNPYMNSITGFDYSRYDEGERIGYPLDGELREIVIDYLKKKVDVMKSEFESL